MMRLAKYIFALYLCFKTSVKEFFTLFLFYAEVGKKVRFGFLDIYLKIKRPTEHYAAAGFFLSFENYLSVRAYFFIVTEEKRYAPYSCKSYDNVYYSCKY